MAEIEFPQQMEAISRKLDIILEEIALQQQHRREMDDLKDDLFRIAKDTYQTAIVELEQVHDQLSTADMLFLGKKLLRNVNNITAMFEQVESVKGFLDDFTPISRELMIDVMNKLDEFDRKGYFEFIKELLKGMDNVVSSFSIDDVKHLSDNIVTIVSTVKNLTQPDMLQTINNALAVYKNLDIEIAEKVTLLSLVKEFNTPEVKRGLAFAMLFLRNLAQQHALHSFQSTSTSETN